MSMTFKTLAKVVHPTSISSAKNVYRCICPSRSKRTLNAVPIFNCNSSSLEVTHKHYEVFHKGMDTCHSAWPFFRNICVGPQVLKFHGRGKTDFSAAPAHIIGRLFSTDKNLFDRNKSNTFTTPKNVLKQAQNLKRNVVRSSKQLNSKELRSNLNLVRDELKQAKHRLDQPITNMKDNLSVQNKKLQEKLQVQRARSIRAVNRLQRNLKVKKEDVRTIPNLLTSLRILSAPVLASLVVHEYYGVSLSIFVLAGLTDMLDGYIARNFKNQRTAFGTALDPLADKFLMCFLTLSLTSVDLIPVPFTALVVMRDAGLVLASFYIRYISLAEPRTLARYFDVSHVTAKLYPSNISKINTGLQISFIALTLAAPVFDFVGNPWLQGLMYVTATTTFLSGADYIFSWRKRLKIIKNN